jgi:hypothetical protein
MISEKDKEYLKSLNDESLLNLFSDFVKRNHYDPHNGFFDLQELSKSHNIEMWDVEAEIHRRMNRGGGYGVDY